MVIFLSTRLMMIMPVGIWKILFNKQQKENTENIRYIYGVEWRQNIEKGSEGQFIVITITIVLFSGVVKTPVDFIDWYRWSLDCYNRTRVYKFNMHIIFVYSFLVIQKIVLPNKAQIYQASIQSQQTCCEISNVILNSRIWTVCWTAHTYASVMIIINAKFIQKLCRF